MSEFFAFNPKGAESLDAFNQRVSQFCLDNPVVDVVVSTGPGPVICLSLTEPDDLPVLMPQAIQPIILALEPETIKSLERYIGSVHTQLKEQYAKTNPEDGELSIYQTRTYPCADDPKRGYALILVNLYELEQAATDGAEA